MDTVTVLEFNQNYSHEGYITDLAFGVIEFDNKEIIDYCEAEDRGLRVDLSILSLVGNYMIYCTN